MTSTAAPTTTPGFRRREDCRLEDLLAVVAEPTDPAAFPHADRVEQGVLVYEAGSIRPLLDDPGTADTVRAEQREGDRSVFGRDSNVSGAGYVRRMIVTSSLSSATAQMSSTTYRCFRRFDVVRRDAAPFSHGQHMVNSCLTRRHSDQM